MNLNDYLKYNRIVLIGYPKTGKTTLSHQVTDRLVLHADDFLHLKWEEQAPAMVSRLKDHAKYLLEGCAAVRTLEKGLDPDCIVVLSTPHIPLSPPQANFGKGCMTILKKFTNPKKIPIIYA